MLAREFAGESHSIDSGPASLPRDTPWMIALEGQWTRKDAKTSSSAQPTIFAMARASATDYSRLTG